MAFYLSPLVDVNEIDLTTTIPAVATSIGCLIMRNAYKGPERKRWLVTSEDDLVETFGKPTSDASAYRDFLAGAGFFRWGTKLYATRTMPTSATFAGSMATSGTSATFESFPSPYLLRDMPEEDPDQFDEITVTTSHIFWLIAASRGAWGNNIRVAVVDRTNYLAINNGDVDWDNTSESTGPAIQSTDSPLSDNKDFLIIVETREQGETTYTRKEEWNVSTQEDRVDDEGVTTYAENIINQRSDYIRINFHEDQKNQPISIGTAQWQYLTSGIDSAFSDDSEEDARVIADLDLYANAEDIDVNIFIDADKNETVKSYMSSICESRLDCMAVLDCPRDLVVDNSGNEVEDLRNWRNGTGAYTLTNLNLNTSYASVYANWLEVFDKYNNKYRWVPVSGHVAGVFARTDDVTDPWFAPAGFQRGILSNVRRLAWNPTLGERDILYKNGLNPIVSFAGQGKVVFGQKTMLNRNSAFNRINVRRLFIILEKAISTAVTNFLFEPNDDITRLLLLNLIDPFLRDVRSRRGIFDYLIVCDETNNTPERIDRNELWCDIYVKPTRAAEFIVLNFIATKTGASFTEIAALRAGRA